MGHAQSKNPCQKKLRWSKKGEGGFSVFLLKVKKSSFLCIPLGCEQCIFSQRTNVSNLATMRKIKCTQNRKSGFAATFPKVNYQGCNCTGKPCLFANNTETRNARTEKSPKFILIQDLDSKFILDLSVLISSKG